MNTRLLTFAAAASLALAAFSQTLNVRQGDITFAFPAEQMGDATYADGAFTFMGFSIAASDISQMYVDNVSVSDNTVAVTYSDASASVVVAGNVAQYVDITVDGAHVSIAQSKEVSADTCGEITYTLHGSSSDASFSLDGSFKASLELNGLSLHNPSGAAIDIQNGKRIKVAVKSDNAISDGASGSQKGALVCKGHLEFKGSGSLDITGNASHAIYAKEYVEMKTCTINILGAVKDGVNCTQHFTMESGELNISATGDDGIQTDFKDASAPDDDDTGSISILGGKVNIAVTAVAAKGMKAEGNINVSGGEVLASVSGKGKWDDAKSKTKASSCLSADADVNITGGSLNLTASGSGGKGISCDGTLTIDSGKITILTTGGIFAYVNGKEYDGYTGNTDNLNSDAKSSPKGMKADTELIINGGEIFVTTTGNGGEGIESKGTLTINDGTIVVNSYDDAINSSSHMYINGGDITVVATNNDGLDSNGNLYIAGGVTRAFGARAPECGIDANEEQGYSVFFTGGLLLAAGGGNSTPSSNESTQPYITANASLSANSEVTLKSGDTVLASFTVPSNYNSNGSNPGNGGPGGFMAPAYDSDALKAPGGGGWNPGGGGPGGDMGGSSLLITCPGLTSGSSYTLKTGTTTTTVTAVTKGGNSGPGGWH